LNPDLT